MPASPRPSPAATAAGRAIGAYQRYVSPLLGPHCRFHPTCSTYARQAIDRFGLWRGGWLSIKRLARCHPFTAGGHDPVPEASAAPRRGRG